MIPIRAIVLVGLAAALLGLVNIGSTAAFHALTSLALIGHHTSYLLPIVLLTARRFHHKEIPFGPWTLGKWGLSINVVAIMYSIILLVFMVFPPYQPLTPSNMNYAGPIFGFVLLMCFILWFVYGRRIYNGPVRDVIDEKNIKS